MLNLVGKELLPTSARWATVWLAVYSLRQHFGPQPKWQSVGRLCLDLAQLVCLSLSLVEPGKIIYIFLFTVYRILLCLSPMTSRILAKELSLNCLDRLNFDLICQTPIL